MRTELKKLYDEKLGVVEFEAIFGRYGFIDDKEKVSLGYNEGYETLHEYTPTVLLKNVTYQGKEVADHVWLNVNKPLKKLGLLQPGDKIKFDGRITKYTSGRIWTDWDYEKQDVVEINDYKEDYGIKFANRNVCGVGFENREPTPTSKDAFIGYIMEANRDFYIRYKREAYNTDMVRKYYKNMNKPLPDKVQEFIDEEESFLEACKEYAEELETEYIAFEADLEEHLDDALNEAVEKYPKWIKAFKDFGDSLKVMYVYSESKTVDDELWDLVKEGKNLYFEYVDRVLSELQNNNIAIQEFEDFINGKRTELTYNDYEWNDDVLSFLSELFTYTDWV